MRRDATDFARGVETHFVCEIRKRTYHEPRVTTTTTTTGLAWHAARDNYYGNYGNVRCDGGHITGIGTRVSKTLQSRLARGARGARAR
eukprot:2350844-Prymnesium_polylepis.1